MEDPERLEESEGSEEVEDPWPSSEVEDFVEDYLDQTGDSLPTWVCVDYERTWDSALRFDFDFDEDNGIMWLCNW